MKRPGPAGSHGGVTDNGRMDVAFGGEMWRWPGESGWHFVSLPEALADDIAQRFAGRAKGFGSLRVHVRVGETDWVTSIFPDSKAGTYILPIKRQVRDRERIGAGDIIAIHLTLPDS